MDHERFDELAKTLSSGASRRKVIGGAIAGLVGASIAKVSGADAKGGKKGRKKKVGKESLCTPAETGLCALQAGCCNPTGDPALQCITIPQQNVNAAVKQPGPCGNIGGTCRTCPAGTYCVGPANNRHCVCDFQSCPNGCCQQIDGNFGTGVGNYVCVENGSGQRQPDGGFYCGTGPGPFNIFTSTCNYCGDTFSGCCTADGACNAGTSNAACGTRGEICDVCANDSSCGVDQACTGATTQPPECPTGQTKCGTACVDLATNPSNCGACGNDCPACGRRRRRECQGGTCGCSKKRKKKKH